MGGQTDAMKTYRANQQKVTSGGAMSDAESEAYAKLEKQGMSGMADESPEHYAKMIGSMYGDLKNQASRMISPNLFGRDTSAPATIQNNK